MTVRSAARTLATRYARLIRFALVGVVNTAVYYGLFLLLQVVLRYLLAHVIAFVLAMIGSYFLNCFVTFRVRPAWRTFLLFPLSNLSNFTLTTAGLWVAVDLLGADPRIAALAVAALAVPVTYLVTRMIMAERAR